MKKCLKILAAAAISAVMVLSLAACGGSASGDKHVIVGSKDFTEGEIIAELYALALVDAGFTVERKMGIAGSVVHTSLTSGEIDLYPEYTGTGLITILKKKAMTDPDEVYKTVKKAYDEKFDVTWLDYAQANDGEGLFVSKKVSDKYGIKTISDLQKNAGKIRFATQGEFEEREDGMPGLEKLYGPFNWKSSKIYDNGLKWEVIDNDEADAADAYTTEAHLSETDKYVLLEDDKHMWPPYNLAPVVRNDVLDKYPDIADALNKLSATLDTETVTELNAKVDLEGEEVEDVASEYWDSVK